MEDWFQQVSNDEELALAVAAEESEAELRESAYDEYLTSYEYVMEHDKEVKISGDR